MLGVSAATVSRMLKSLEDLGLVVRSRGWPDTRQRHVEATHDGAARVDTVIRDVMAYGAVDLAVESAVALGWRMSEVSFALLTFEGDLNRVRQAFGDTAGTLYFMHRDDD